MGSCHQAWPSRSAIIAPSQVLPVLAEPNIQIRRSGAIPQSVGRLRLLRLWSQRETRRRVRKRLILALRARCRVLLAMIGIGESTFLCTPVRLGKPSSRVKRQEMRYFGSA